MNTFGRLFRISIFGESHGESIGILIDGCLPGIKLGIEDFTEDLSKRKAGKFGTTDRIENDTPCINSGIFNGRSTGAPILILFNNADKDSSEYETIKDTPRPGHSDFTAKYKFNGYNDYRGGGHFSGRLTLGLVVAGVIAKKNIPGIEIKATIIEKEHLAEKIKLAQNEGDSVGAVIECKISGVNVGLGEPFFDSIESIISHLVFSIPGIKGIEFGDGFTVRDKMGSEVNDLIVDKFGTTETNHSGGINGGISNGNEIIFRVVVKPTSSISKIQKTFNLKSEKIEDLSVKGRHDTCFALRVPVIVEAVTAIALADLYLLNNKIRGQNGSKKIKR